MDAPDATALITGGHGGLGRAVVEAFRHAGYRVVAPAIEEADLLDPADVDRVIREAGLLSAVVCLVGGFAAGKRVHETTPEDWDNMLRLNLITAVNVCRAACPVLMEAGGGPIVLTSSRAAIKPFKGASPYATSKAALRAFVAAMHADYREDGIRVYAVEPDKIDTPANRAAMPDAVDKGVPPAQIAQVILWLCSPAAESVAGRIVPVYGAGSPP
jgi:NAD(P)-dependent dehydrogenase (short-subunit alcohol dehydrogenase family)